MKIEGLSKDYKIEQGTDVHALRNVSFGLPDKGMIFILGRSGSGKTTLLKLLAGLDKPNSGAVYFHGQNISSFSAHQSDCYRNTYCGFIFQEYNLLPELSVEGNISLSLEMQGEKETKERVKAALEEVGLEGYEKRKVFELSGGQRQRVAIARALIKRPEIIFADEPTGALDKETGRSVLGLLKRLSVERLVLIVTHDREDAEEYGDRIIELEDGAVIGDTEPTQRESEQKGFELRKADLSFKTAFKIGSSNLRHHPIRLCLTLILSVIAFTLFGMSFTLITRTEERAVIDCVYDVGSDGTLAVKQDANGMRQTISEEEREEFAAVFPETIGLIEGVTGIEELDGTLTAYYSVKPFAFGFLDEDLVNVSALDGSFPKTEEEIIITKYTAAQILSLRGGSNAVGMTLNINGATFCICGVLDTGFSGEAFGDLKGVYDTVSDRFTDLYYQLSKSAHTTVYSSKQFLSAFGGEYSALLINLKGLSKAEFISSWSKVSGYKMKNPMVDKVGSVFYLVGNLHLLFVIFCVVSGVFAAALLIYFISQSIEDKRSTISLLKMIGAKNQEIFKIFLWEGVLMGAVLFFLSIICCILLLYGINLLALGEPILPVFCFEFLNGLMLFGFTVFCTSVGTVTPLSRLMKISPDALFE